MSDASSTSVSAEEYKTFDGVRVEEGIMVSRSSYISSTVSMGHGCALHFCDEQAYILVPHVLPVFVCGKKREGGVESRFLRIQRGDPMPRGAWLCAIQVAISSIVEGVDTIHVSLSGNAGANPIPFDVNIPTLSAFLPHDVIRVSEDPVPFNWRATEVHPLMEHARFLYRPGTPNKCYLDPTEVDMSTITMGAARGRWMSAVVSAIPLIICARKPVSEGGAGVTFPSVLTTAPQMVVARSISRSSAGYASCATCSIGEALLMAAEMERRAMEPVRQIRRHTRTCLENIYHYSLMEVGHTCSYGNNNVTDYLALARNPPVPTLNPMSGTVSCTQGGMYTGQMHCASAALFTPTMKYGPQGCDCFEGFSLCLHCGTPQ